MFSAVIAAIVGIATVVALFRLKGKRRSKVQAKDILSPADVVYTKSCKKKLLGAIEEAQEGAISTYEGQASIISKLLSGGLVSVDGLLRKNAHELFILHREAGPVVEGGLGVRITVQLNLFGGSVANLGSVDQRTWLQGVFDRGELGCFCLTEAGAGVLSGLVVDTTATFVGGDEPHFDLHSPTLASRKTWISQGLTSKWGVVIARLLVKDPQTNEVTVDKGPHAFVIDMKAKGCHVEDMPSKIDFNGLDNANVWFEHMRLDLDAMLTGISSVSADGLYHLKNPDVPFRFVEVAQRLLSGRICIAGAGVNQARKVLDAVESYSEKRLIPTGRDQKTPLSELPVMRDTLEELKAVMCVFRHFTKSVEDSFISDPTITDELVHRIACGKIEAVGFCIDAILALKARVGSLSLQDEGPFGSKTDILYVYRFAEGDTSILRQKMARDSLKAVAKNGIFKELLNIPLSLILNKGGVGCTRAKLSWTLVKLAAKFVGKRGKAKLKAWFEAHREVERVAKLRALLTVYDDVRGREGLRGSRELQLFKQRYFGH